MKVLGWYVVDKDNFVYTCEDKADAEKNAKGMNREFWDMRKLGPHRAVLLAEIDESEIPQDQKGER